MSTENKKNDEVEHGLIVWARVDAVIRLILENPAYLQKKRVGDLTRNVVEQIKKLTGEEISERTAQRYIKEAKVEIKKIGKLKVEEKFERAIFYRMSIVQRAREAGDLKTELNTLKDIAELEGLYPDKEKIKKNYNIDMSRFTEYGLERLKKGDAVEDVLADPKSIKHD